MIIDGFDIKGISNIGHVRLDIREMNALIAPNGYGKSNVLSAISFGMDFLKASVESRRQMLGSGFAPINEAMIHNKCFFMALNVNGQQMPKRGALYRNG